MLKSILKLNLRDTPDFRSVFYHENRNETQHLTFKSYFYIKTRHMRTIDWKTAKEFEDITYKKADGVARIAFNRPDVRNAFRPKTTSELYQAFYDAQEDTSIGVVLLSAEGPSGKDGVFSFCSGGDQRARGHQGYVGEDGMHRLNILEVQRLIRFMPKAVIAVVPGWAVGGGHSLHVVCDLTLASKEHAIFKQTDADVTSFDGGYGSAYLAKMVGQNALGKFSSWEEIIPQRKLLKWGWSMP